MESTKVKLILPDGTSKEAKATRVSITKSEEPWGRYELEDGAVVRVRPIVARVMRTEEFDSEGNPIYHVIVTNIVFIDAPDSLKKKPGAI